MSDVKRYFMPGIQHGSLEVVLAADFDALRRRCEELEAHCKMYHVPVADLARVTQERDEAREQQARPADLGLK